MSKREKIVYGQSSQVAHLWANRSQAQARTNSGNVSFASGAIYSYGSHFMIARHYENQKGETCVLFTRRTYSVTTARHISEARCAVPPGVPVFDVSDPANYSRFAFNAQGNKAQLRADCKLYLQDAQASLEKAKRARTDAAYYISNARTATEQAQRMSAFFKLGMRIPDLTLSPELQLRLDQNEARRAEAENFRRVTEARRLEFARLDDAEKFVKWLAGEPFAYCPWSYKTDEHGSAYLRAKGNLVETSQGAHVTFDEARRAFQFVKLCKEHGRAYKRNGQRAQVGSFTIDAIDEHGNANVGCHYFSWEQISAFAERAGIFTLEPSAVILSNDDNEGTN